MSHNDLKSVVVKKFGQRQNILKEIGKYRSQNIIEKILSSQTVVEFSCHSCESIYKTLKDLNEHVASHTREAQPSPNLSTSVKT